MNGDTNRCPFCGNSDTEVNMASETSRGESVDGYVIRCRNCGAWGPWADTVKGAKEGWNKRA